MSKTNDVLMDLSTVTSASSNPDFAIQLLDLSKLVEAIILHDNIYYYGSEIDQQITKSDIFNEGLPKDILSIFSQGKNVNDFGLKEVPATLITLNEDGSEKIRMPMRQVVSSGSLPEHIADINSPFYNKLLEQVDFNLFSFGGFYWQGEVDNAERVNDVKLVASRTYYYLESSKSLSIPYSPQYFRNPFVNLLAPSNYFIDRYKLYKDFERKFSEEIRNLMGVERIESSVPMLFFFVLKQANERDPYDIFRIALELRNSKEFTQIRGLFGQLMDSYESYNYRLASEINRNLNSEFERVKQTLSGIMLSRIDMKLKPWGLPSISLDFRSVVQGLKDRKIGQSMSKLGRIAEYCYETLSLSKEIEKVFGRKFTDKNKSLLLKVQSKAETNNENKLL